MRFYWGGVFFSSDMHAQLQITDPVVLISRLMVRRGHADKQAADGKDTAAVAL